MMKRKAILRMKHLTNLKNLSCSASDICTAASRNKSKAELVFNKAVVGNNGNAGATGREPLSDFAQVSDHGLLTLEGTFTPVFKLDSLRAKN